jgi:ferric-dicitrate binding protein FerR (iron transport regulator)
MKNEMDQTAIDILLASYFAGEADAAERAQVENWIASSEKNRTYFDASKRAWDASAALLNDQRFNTDAAWKKVHLRMNGMHDEKRTGKRKYMWMAAASVALLLTVLSVFLLNNDSTGEVWQVAVETSTETQTDTLPDASIVSLNRNTKIEYASEFDGETRQVNLSGEAFFEVQRNEQQPFIIRAGVMEVKVLGTSFNVRAYPGEDSVHVSVETGKVECVANGDTVIITPGQYAVYDKGSGKIRLGKEDDPNRSAYRNRIFRFSDTPLASMVQQLNAAYGCKIILNNDAIKSCRFSSTKVFNNEPVGNIIEAIKVTFPNITSQDNGNVIILDGTGCN